MSTTPTVSFPLQTVRQMHDEWAAMCVPTGASEQQRQDMERCFFCGAISMLKGVTLITDLTPEQSQRTLEGWTKELTEYMAEMANDTNSRGNIFKHKTLQ